MRNRTRKPTRLQPLPFLWWMNFLGPEASGRSGRVDRSIVLRIFFHQQRLHQGSDINPEYVEYVYNVYIINIIIIILITALRQYMTVYIQKTSCGIYFWTCRPYLMRNWTRK